ncbi:amino acid ABC transporter substrate-binding protein [Sharpea azabuensis]|uniref:amino acid ABC transporter substrate-binding protein n=1 Tax=Sharpea azabuensis TaxID=322505 RepID=UPI0013DAE375|nr:amino acid ABC transporter substrate-binding protein [Sharpea azabuensis]
MKLKRLGTVLLAGLLAVGLTACGGSSSKKADTFTVGFDQNFPPFGYKDDKGNFTGFDIDLAKETAKRMNKKIKLQPIDWDAKDMELDSGTIDCIWNGFTMNGRENKYTWTKPYMNNRQVVVVKKASKIATLKDLAGKIMEVQKDSSAQSAIDANKELKSSFKNYLSVADYNTAMMDLESGAVDAVAMDEFVAKKQIEGKENTYAILDESISSEQYAVGFKKGNTKLRDEVEKTLIAMVKDGTFAKISKKWFKADYGILKAD